MHLLSAGNAGQDGWQRVRFSSSREFMLIAVLSSVCPVCPVCVYVFVSWPINCQAFHFHCRYL